MSLLTNSICHFRRRFLAADHSDNINLQNFYANERIRYRLFLTYTLENFVEYFKVFGLRKVISTAKILPFP